MSTVVVAHVPIVAKLPAPAVVAYTSKPARLESVDLLSGAIMIIMALDHVRDYVSGFAYSPTDLAHTTPALFFTRWITHFCAPIFIFLAGTGSFLSLGRGKSLSDLQRVLHDLLDAERTVADTLMQCFAFHALHDDHRLPVVLQNVVHRANERMIERRSGARFAKKHLA